MHGNTGAGAGDGCSSVVPRPPPRQAPITGDYSARRPSRQADPVIATSAEPGPKTSAHRPSLGTLGLLGVTLLTAPGAPATSLAPSSAPALRRRPGRAWPRLRSAGTASFRSAYAPAAASAGRALVAFLRAGADLPPVGVGLRRPAVRRRWPWWAAAYRRLATGRCSAARQVHWPQQRLPGHRLPHRGGPSSGAGRHVRIHSAGVLLARLFSFGERSSSILVPGRCSSGRW